MPVGGPGMSISGCLICCFYVIFVGPQVSINRQGRILPGISNHSTEIKALQGKKQCLVDSNILLVLIKG